MRALITLITLFCLCATASGLSIGGSLDDSAAGIATDAAVNIYVTGQTQSEDFPVINAFQPENAGGYDAFLAKFTPEGSLVYATYLGGSGYDSGRAIALDNEGHIWVTGYTHSPDFPDIGDTPLRGGGDHNDAFLAEFDTDGRLLRTALIGGTGNDDASAIAIKEDRIYIAGQTTSTDLRAENGFQETPAGQIEAFVVCTDRECSGILASTFLGGSHDDYARGIAIGPDNRVSVTGYTYSSKYRDFPVIDNVREAHVFSYDAFLTTFSPDLDEAVFSTYLGGDSGDRAEAVVVDDAGRISVTGYTYSDNFPVTDNTHSAGDADIFLTTFSPEGEILRSGYFGGEGSDLASGLALDGRQVYITGQTSSEGLLVLEATDDDLRRLMTFSAGGRGAAITVSGDMPVVAGSAPGPSGYDDVLIATPAQESPSAPVLVITGLLTAGMIRQRAIRYFSFPCL